LFIFMAKLNITVNKNKCIASGDCVETAPSVFQLDNDGKSEVANQTGAPGRYHHGGGALVSGQGDHRRQRRDQ